MPRLFKAAFGQPDIARSELELVLPPAVRAHLELDTLRVCPGSFVDEELRQSHTDLLYTVRTIRDHEALVYVLFEHQSSHDAQMPFRLLRYMVRIWEQRLRDHPASALPIVLPVVLHHDQAGWQTAPDFASMLDATPELLEAVRPYQPLFRFVLDDLAVLSLEAIASRALHALTHLVQLGFWSSRSLERLQAAAPIMRAIVAAIARDDRARAMLSQIYLYLLSTAPGDVDVGAVRAILLNVAGPSGREDVVNAAEQLIEQGRAEGRERLRVAIAKALSKRAVPMSELGGARLAACKDFDTLTRWLTRAATAASEAEVFAGDDSA